MAETRQTFDSFMQGGMASSAEEDELNWTRCGRNSAAQRGGDVISSGPSSFEARLRRAPWMTDERFNSTKTKGTSVRDVLASPPPHDTNWHFDAAVRVSMLRPRLR